MKPIRMINRSAIALVLIVMLSITALATNSYAHNVYAAGSKAYSVLNTDSAVYGYVYIEVQDRNGNILTNNENSANTTKLTTSVHYSGYSTHYKARGTFHARIDGVYKTGEKFCYT